MLGTDIERRLPEFCARALEPFCSESDESLWFVRRINLEVPVNAAWQPGQIAGHWAAQLGRSLQRVLNAGERFGEVVRFPNRAAFLGQFVTDLATGTAWDRWWHDSFAGLRSLPTEKAIVEAFLREPTIAESVLISLAEGRRLEFITRSFSSFDAARVIEACASNQPPASSSSAGPAEILESILAVCPAPSITILCPARALHLYVALRRRHPNLSPAALPPAITQALALIDFLSRHGGASDGTWNFGDMKPALTELPSEVATAARYFRPTSSDSSALFARVVGALQAASGSNAMERGGLRETSCGGAFLLLRSMLESGMDGVIRSFVSAGPDGDRAAALFRWFVLFKCLGPGRYAENPHDSGLAFAAGLSRPPDEALSEITALRGDDATRCKRWQQFFSLLATQGRIGTECWLVELITLPAGEPLLVIHDLIADEWLWAGGVAPFGEDLGSALLAAFDRIDGASGYCPGLIIFDAALQQALRVHDIEKLQAQFEPVGWAPPESNVALWRRHDTQSSIDESLCSRYLSRFAPAAPALVALRLTGLERLGDLNFEDDLLWSVMARNVLKDFARRLMGFDQSSPDFLRRNFLDTPASFQVQRTPDTMDILVRLQPPPLHLVLHLAGMESEAVSLPWLGGGTVTLQLVHQ